jgi:hypothetical protein
MGMVMLMVMEMQRLMGNDALASTDL